MQMVTEQDPGLLLSYARPWPVSELCKTLTRAATEPALLLETKETVAVPLLYYAEPLELYLVMG